MTKVGRAVEKGETQGFMKMVVDAQTHEILGAVILETGGDCQSAVCGHAAGHTHTVRLTLGELQPLSNGTSAPR